MARKTAPCGTPAAYNRHIRRKERPCDPCSQANRLYKRDLREKQALAIAKLTAIPDPPSGLTRLEELQEQRDRLHEILHSATCPPGAAAAISKELRAVWAEIDELDKGHGTGMDDNTEALAGGLHVVPIG